MALFTVLLSPKVLTSRQHSPRAARQLLYSSSGMRRGYHETAQRSVTLIVSSVQRLRLTVDVDDRMLGASTNAVYSAPSMLPPTGFKLSGPRGRLSSVCADCLGRPRQLNPDSGTGARMPYARARARIRIPTFAVVTRLC